MISDFNKKGNVILESLTVIIILVVVAIIGIFASQILGDVTTGLTTGDNPVLDDPAASGNLTNLDNRMPATMDGIFAIIFGLMWVFVFVSAFLIDSNPAFFIVSLVLFIGALLVAGWISEFWTDFSVDPEIASEVNQFPITHFVLDNLLIVILGVGATVAIALFAKR